LTKTVFRLTVIILIVSGCESLFGQVVETKKHWLEKHPIDLAFGNISVGIPFSKIFINKFYPLSTLGTEFNYRNKKISQIYQTAKIGWYYNKYNTSAFFINSEIGYRYTFGFGLFADANLGVGYSQLFHPNAIYILNSHREYEQVRDRGKPSIMADYLFSIGFYLAKRVKRPVSIFIRYGNYIQLFYNPDIPVLPQNSFQMGARINIKYK